MGVSRPAARSGVSFSGYGQVRGAYGCYAGPSAPAWGNTTDDSNTSIVKQALKIMGAASASVVVARIDAGETVKVKVTEKWPPGTINLGKWPWIKPLRKLAAEEATSGSPSVATYGTSGSKMLDQLISQEYAPQTSTMTRTPGSGPSGGSQAAPPPVTKDVPTNGVGEGVAAFGGGMSKVGLFIGAALLIGLAVRG